MFRNLIGYTYPLPPSEPVWFMDTPLLFWSKAIDIPARRGPASGKWFMWAFWVVQSPLEV